MIEQILTNRIFLLTLTVAVYYCSTMLYRRFKFALLNPLLVSIVALIAILKLTGIDYDLYYKSNDIINFMLGMAVVALGYTLHENGEKIKGREVSIFISVFVGSLTGIVSVAGIAWLFGADKVVIASLQPKSVTMPIAISVSQNSGGLPALTSVAVILTGILGGIIGPTVLRIFGVKHPIAKGLAMGASSHAAGTARALEMGALEGAVGGAAIGLMGLMTAILIPVLEKVYGLI